FRWAQGGLRAEAAHEGSRRDAREKGTTRKGQALEIHTGADTVSPRLIHLIADAGAEAALAVEREECALVGQVVHEYGRVPAPFQHADAPVDDVVRRKLRVERDGALRERTADIVRRERRQALRPRIAEVLVADLRIAVADVLVRPGGVADPGIPRPAPRRGGGSLVLRDRRHARTVADAGDDRHRAGGIGRRQRRTELRIRMTRGDREVESI